MRWFTKGRGATGELGPRRLAARTSLLVMGACLHFAGCGSDTPGGPSSTDGAAGAGGSDSQSDAAVESGTPIGDATSEPPVNDARPTNDVSDARGGSDTGNGTPDARDTGVTPDVARDAEVDRVATADASDATIDKSADVVADTSTDVRVDTTGPADDAGACGCNAYGAAMATGTEPSSLTELSGIVASRKNPGVLYAHNDSGSNSTLIVMSDTAQPLGQFVLSNVNAVDWEDVAVGPCDLGSCIFVGEIGDNNLAYASRAVYRFAEPVISPTTSMGTTMVTADALTYVYPDGRHNAETLLVDPNSGDIYVVTKVSNVASTVYRLPKPFTPGTQATMEKVGDLALPGSAGLVTGGDVHPCGTRMLIRTYPMIYEFKLTAGQPFASIFAATPTAVTTPTQDQESKGEGVTYAADGVGYFTASELDGKSSRSLFRVRCL
ncbi:MAG: hypothetical protein ABW133_04585 [Polyangiaceae bacterium]